MKILQPEEVQTEYQRELNSTRMILKSPGTYKEDYQMRMIRDNQIGGILEVRGYGVDNHSIYEYDISGKKSLNKTYERNTINIKEIKKLLKKILKLSEELKKYMLDVDCIILDPEYVFAENEEYFFCYHPCVRKDIRKSFHNLTEFFVRHTDYQDEDCVRLSFLLHKETMEENYSLEKILEMLEREEVNEKPKESIYARKEHDWITDQEMGSTILRETDNMWTPMKRFLQKHKKPKWGDFDGIYIDEEFFE